MKGMEMMFAKMLGLSSEDMAKKVSEFEQFVKGGSSALIEIAENQKKILALLEAKDGQ